jgi:hypothetical protein
MAGFVLISNLIERVSYVKWSLSDYFTTQFPNIKFIYEVRTQWK